MLAKTLLCGNWKMKLSAQQSVALAQRLVTLAGELKKTDIWLAPSFTALPATLAATKGTTVRVGAQNVHWEQEGAFTGEVSVPMLREVGCSFAIVGHSERRHICGETHDLCAKRTLGALKQKFDTIFCVGETLEERKNGITAQVLQAQMQPLIEAVTAADLDRIIIAYEPVWAIGTGVVAQVPDIKEAHAEIHAQWKRKFNSQCPPILYGGSVSADNIGEILQVPLVAGALIGGASLKFESMESMARSAEGKNNRL